MENNNLTDLLNKLGNCCPNCKSTYGFYQLSKVSGHVRTVFNWDGSNGDNTNMNDSIIYKDLKTLRCCECDYKIK